MKGTKAGFDLHDLLDPNHSLMLETTAQEYVRSAWYNRFDSKCIMCLANHGENKVMSYK